MLGSDRGVGQRIVLRLGEGQGDGMEAKSGELRECGVMCHIDLGSICGEAKFFPPNEASYKRMDFSSILFTQIIGAVTEMQVIRMLDVNFCCSCCLLFHNLPEPCCLECSYTHHYTIKAVPGHTVKNIYIACFVFCCCFLYHIST